ncbi:putative receptor-like protein kinase [Citrus sinensis]|uniref:Receptor-like protein kinase n=1 Tax=Citrus sinensis TaxID=2711 RepID=A0ACB8INR6_CITSI|nr:putative receptor-like protein kinase [Citrus sinensis]
MLTSISISSFAMLIWYCFISLLLNSHSFSAAKSNEIDRIALLAIKLQLHDDPLGFTSSWNSTTSENLCQWRGVTCGHRRQRVTKLDLGNQNIGGFLSSYVGNLSFLRFINFSRNNFYGKIPDEVGRLSRLQYLILAKNSFSGKIPTPLSRCSNLIMFDAQNNKLVGDIPVEIGCYLFKLENLSLAENHLTGQLPVSIGNLSALQVIDIRGNRLGGKIPDTLGQLRKLIYLNIGRNQFSGFIPPSIYNISSFEFIFLQSNRFHGSLPFDMVANLPNLRKFVAAKNNLTGFLPISLSNASNLELLELRDNQFIGKMSINFNSLKNLSVLILGNNHLGNRAANDLDFVTVLANCSKLENLGLYDNQFGGLLPHSLANLSNTMTTIDIGGNYFSGTIPPGLGNLVHLNSIAMEGNQLIGTVPPEIGWLKNLQSLYLNSNFLHGYIPSSLGNLTMLTLLALEINNLQGKIPSSLGNCTSLIMLTLSKNKLDGVLPPQILSVTTLSLFLNLSDNLLSGSLPSEIGNLKNLVQLDISGNRFSGDIPGTLSACTSLEYVKMQDNSFSGSIPPSLNFLKSIKVLDLSSNKLSGQIPKYLENLSFLEYLNLSYNHFEGEVPKKGVFSNKTRFSLSGNGKLCGGLDEFHLPSCPSKRSRKLIATILKVVIPTIVSCLILSACFIVIYGRRRSTDRSFERTTMVEQQFPMISYAKLSKATSEFSSSNMVGQGSFGTVFKGIIGENGMLVAVKVLNLMQKGALKSFLTECEALRSIRHRNLIKIITICSSIDFNGVDFKAIVYDFMQNGSLEEWLHQNNDKLEVCNLSLIQTLNIAIDVASAIEYLHHHCKPPVVHGDLKPSNVLLDHDMVAHVGDFGLAKFLPARPLDTVVETPSSSSGIKGTVGYIAPEYGTGSEASMTGDVYSFGILLLEMFSRRRPTDSMFHEGLTLHEFSKMVLPEKVMEIVDPSLLLEVRANNSMSRGGERVKIEECLVAVIRIGVVCSMESPTDRMQMRDVVVKLCAAREAFVSMQDGLR